MSSVASLAIDCFLYGSTGIDTLCSRSFKDADPVIRNRIILSEYICNNSPWDIRYTGIFSNRLALCLFICTLRVALRAFQTAVNGYEIGSGDLLHPAGPDLPEPRKHPVDDRFPDYVSPLDGESDKRYNKPSSRTVPYG